MIILRSSNWRSLDFHNEGKCYRREESERYIFILLRLTLNYERPYFCRYYRSYLCILNLNMYTAYIYIRLIFLNYV